MKISPQWIREFVEIKADDHQLAEQLTNAGAAVEGISGADDGMVFEMEITTNRPDAMNHYGIAREASAIYDVALKPIVPQIGSAGGPGGDARPPSFAIEIEDAEGCARYTARILRGVTIKASPASIVKRLESVDQRPINNAADASNYTLWEMGHPTHAFDLDLLEGGKIIVRRARAGETLKTLDGVDRQLSLEDLVIADANKPVALAGVMGGFDTMITEKTKNVLIESAWFDPVSVRKSSRRHGLHTDASHRFERGADYGATSLACARVAQRILESGGGQLQGGEIDAMARKLDLAPIQLDRSEVRRILGEELSTTEIQRILTRLGFMAAAGDGSDFIVQVPSWRLDVEREIDLIEELARIHGYDKVANTLPAYVGSVVELPDAAKDAKLRTALLALGYNEAVSLTFISHADAEMFSAVPVVELANPLSEEASIMRTSMVPGMLNMVAYNLNRGTDNVRLFEAGNVYELAGSKSVEWRRICVGATGGAVAQSVNQAARPISFFDLKGDVENLLSAFDNRAVYYDPHTAEYYHPGRSARAVMDGIAVAQFGQVHPDIAAARKLRQDVFIAELYLERLYKHELRQVRYEPLPRYPAVERDFSFVFADSVLFERIQQAVSGLQTAELRSFVPVEIFRGGAIPAGKYSILLRGTFQSGERTLREDEVAQWSGKIVSVLEGLDGTQRA
jgi:phenylalanyl-tRNA synthetase beta chain